MLTNAKGERKNCELKKRGRGVKMEQDGESETGERALEKEKNILALTENTKSKKKTK